MTVRTKHRWLCLALCVCFCFAAAPAAKAEKQPSAQADTSWYQAEGVFFTLEDQSDLLGFFTLVSQGVTFQNQSVQLAADIDLKGVALPAAGVFSGFFDAKGHTVSNITLEGEKAALFDTLTTTAVVQNVVFHEVNVTGRTQAAVLALLMQDGARLASCTVDGGTVSAPTAGGLVVHLMGQATLSHCENSAAVTGELAAGGLAAQSTATDAAASLRACVNRGAVSAGQRAGGLVGQAQRLSMVHCLNFGEIALTGSAGSAGGLAGEISAMEMEDCTNSGAVTTSQKAGGKIMLGGLAGSADGAASNVCNQSSGKVQNTSTHSQSASGGLFGSFQGTLQKGRNLAAVTGGRQAGGCLGQAAASVRDGFAFSMLENSGEVSGSGEAGGVCAVLTVASDSKTGQAANLFWQCANRASVKGTQAAGGLIGTVSISEKTSLRALAVDCFNTGAIESTGNAGGLIGVLPRVQTDAAQALISNCYHNGKVLSQQASGTMVGRLSAVGNVFASCASPKGQAVSAQHDTADGVTPLDADVFASDTLVSLLNGSGSVWHLSAEGVVEFAFIGELLAPSADVADGAVVKHTHPLVLTTTAGGTVLYTISASVDGQTQVSKQQRVQSGQALSLAGFAPGTALSIEIIAQRDGCADSAPVTLHLQIQAVQPLTITGLSLVSASREYDGTNTIALAGAPALMGAITENDDIHVDGQAFGRFLDKDAGTGKVVSVQGLSLVGADADYYTLITPIFTADIVRRPLTLQNVTVADKGYDGTASANVSNVDLVGVLEGESVSLDYLSAKAAFISKDRGDTVPAFITNLQLQGADSRNYSLLETTAMTAGRIVTLPAIERNGTVATGQCTLALDGLDDVMPSQLSPAEGDSVLLYVVANDIPLPESAKSVQGENTQSLLAVDLQLKQAYVRDGARQSESTLPPGMLTAPLTVRLTFSASDSKQDLSLAQLNAAGELVQLETQTQKNDDGTVTLSAQTQTMGTLVVRGQRTESTGGLSLSTLLPYILLLLIVLLIVLAGRRTKGAKS